MESKQNSLKIIIFLLSFIIILLIGFMVFCFIEFEDEKEDIREIHSQDKVSSINSNNKNETDVTTTNDSTVTNNNITTTNDNKISSEDALNIALEDAKVNRKDTLEIDVEIDYKYNQTVYEVTFDFQNYEYEYYINAENGNIVKSFKEID